MAAPAQANTLRASDFPEGIGSKAAADKLFQYLNPFLAAVGTVTTQGTGLQQNIDGQFATLNVTAGASWTPVNVRLKDGKKPQFVLARATNRASSQVTMLSVVYTYLGTGPTGNVLRLDDAPGLTADSVYVIDLFIFF